MLHFLSSFIKHYNFLNTLKNFKFDLSVTVFGMICPVLEVIICQHYKPRKCVSSDVHIGCIVEC